MRTLAVIALACLLPVFGCDSEDNGRRPETPVVPAQLPLGTTCQVEIPPLPPKAGPNGAVAGLGYNPFCIAWTDIFQDESGFKVVLRYGLRETVYTTPAGVNEFYPPPQDWPSANGKGDVGFFVYGLTPSGEVLEAASPWL